MDYLKPQDARNLSGLRLALTVGVPGPWGESAKKILEYKGIDFVAVAQYPAEPNLDLVSWTGIRNAPIAIYNDEAPKSNFQDIVALAERLKPAPQLIPEDSKTRILCSGISNEICGEGGFGWSRRLMSRASFQSIVLTEEEKKILLNAPVLDRETMKKAYGSSDLQVVRAENRVAEILENLRTCLIEQKSVRSPYFVGQTVSACDIHWACFSNMLLPLPEEVNPMPDWLRLSYGSIGGLELGDFEELITHRDMMFEKHLKLPLDF